LRPSPSSLLKIRDEHRLSGHLTTAWLKRACPLPTPCRIVTIDRAMVPHWSLNEPEPPLLSLAPRAAGPPASTTPSPKCVLSCDSTHQMTSPETRAPLYRAEIVRGISGGAAIEYTDGDILPALPEMVTLRERRPFSHSISDLRSMGAHGRLPKFL